MGSLKKLTTLKSTRIATYDFMHFSLACMKAEDAAALFSLEDQAMLGKAKNMKTYTVYHDCQELGSTFQGIKALAETGTLKTRQGKMITMDKRRKTMVRKSPSTEEEAEIDDDDQFHEHFKAFVQSHAADVQGVSQGL